jgi:hypothetical protein
VTTNAEDAHHSIFGVTCKDDLLMPEKQALSFLKNRAKLRASPKYNSLDDSEGSVHFSCWLKFNGGVERFLGLKCPPSVPRDAFASLCESELVDALKARAQLRSADASWPAVHAEVLGLTDDQRTKLAEFVLGRVRAKLTTLK